MPPLSEQVILITGASAVIGEATARRLARSGARLILTARRADRLKALATELDPTGIRVVPFAADLTLAEQREALITGTLARFGRLDALINNAGYAQRGPLERVPLESIRHNYEVNVFAVVALCQLVAPVLRDQGSGRIVNITSVAGRIARPLTSVYDSTKHALEALSDGLRGELKPFGVQVVVIRPGFIATDFVSAATAASADTLADLGPYTPYMSRLRDGFAELRRLAASPDVIARCVERALSARRPCLHYTAPAHAHLFLFARWLFPARVVDWFIRLRPRPV
jgi:short-subunit dehydrogenase